MKQNIFSGKIFKFLINFMFEIHKQNIQEYEILVISIHSLFMNFIFFVNPI